MNQDSFFSEAEIVPSSTSIKYQTGLFLCTIGMIILPIIYLALIGVTGYLTYFVATNIYFFDNIKAWWLALLLYLTPVISGIILLYYMIKPLFIRLNHSMGGINIDAKEGEDFIRIVNALCKKIKAPVPSEITLNCDANASASFRNGIFGMVKNELHLTVGIPLIHSLNIQQLVGVLAHELGHFSQSAGMRLSYIIRSINLWFFKTVSEGERIWDSLADKTGKIDIRIDLILIVSRIFISISQFIIKFLMRLGHLISSYMLRQMEYDADYYEIQIAGTEAFIKTSQIIILTSDSQYRANQQLDITFEQKILPQDYNHFVYTGYRRMKKKTKKKIIDEANKLKTKSFDTHPSGSDRIENAKRLDMKGIITDINPASTLFTNIDRLSQEATREMYQNNPGLDIKAIELLPMEKYEKFALSHNEQQKSLIRFWGDNTFSLIATQFVIEFHVGNAKNKQTSEELRETSKKAFVRIIKHFQEYLLIGDRMLMTKMESEICDIQRLRPEILYERKAHLSAKLKDFEAQYEKYDSQLRLFVESQTKRLENSFQILIESPKLRKKAPYSVKELKDTMLLIDSLTKPFSILIKLTILVRKLNIVGNIEEASNTDREHYSEPIVEKLYNQLKKLRTTCPTTKYPYNNPGQDVSIRDFITAEIPELEEFENIIEYTMIVIDNFLYLYRRLLSIFTYTLEYVESTMNLSIIDLYDIEIKELDQQLPILFKCPECKTELELDKTERKSRKFTCPECERFHEIEIEQDEG